MARTKLDSLATIWFWSGRQAYQDRHEAWFVYIFMLLFVPGAKFFGFGMRSAIFAPETSTLKKAQAVTSKLARQEIGPCLSEDATRFFIALVEQVPAVWDASREDCCNKQLKQALSERITCERTAKWPAFGPYNARKYITSLSYFRSTFDCDDFMPSSYALLPIQSKRAER